MKKKLSVTMVTKNQYKIDAMRRVLTPYNIELDVENFYVPEIQADSCEEIAQFSAQYAASKCNKPVIKADAGFFIDALNGLPGIYASQFQKKLGPAKVLKLMENESDRSAKIVYALAYCEPNKEPIVFSASSSGTIATSIHGDEGMLIDYIFIPQGYEITMGELKKLDRNKADAVWGNAEEQFAKWFSKRNDSA